MRNKAIKVDYLEGKAWGDHESPAVHGENLQHPIVDSMACRHMTGMTNDTGDAQRSMFAPGRHLRPEA